MLEALSIVGLVLFALYWLNAMQCKEMAVSGARRECQRSDVQLLDDTVHQVWISLSRDGEGIWRLWRRYQFDYTEDGLSRNMGEIILLGNRIVHIHLETFSSYLH